MAGETVHIRQLNTNRLEKYNSNDAKVSPNISNIRQLFQRITIEYTYNMKVKKLFVIMQDISWETLLLGVRLAIKIMDFFETEGGEHQKITKRLWT